MHMLLIVIMYLLFATTFTLAKAVVAFIPPFLCIGIRMILAGLLLLGYQAYTKGIVLYKKSYFMLLQVIFFHIYLAYVTEFWALQYAASSKTALIYSLSPFITALIAFLLGHERLGTKKFFGLIIGLTALIPWLLSSTASENIVGHIFFVSFPEIALLIAVISSCYGWILVFRLMKQYHYSPVLINGIAMIGGGCLALISSFIIEGKPSLFWEHDFGVCGNWLISILGLQGTVILYGSFYLIVLIIIANVICYNLYAFLLKRYSATFLSFAGFMSPLFASLLGRIFFGEHLSNYYILTFLFIVLGLYIFYQQELIDGK